MGSVVAGSRLVLRTPTGAVTLRALDTVDLTDGWCLPVLAPIKALTDSVGVLEIPHVDGVLQVAAYLVMTDGRLELRPGSPGPDARPVLQQRRGDVRGAVELAVRGAALDTAQGEEPTEVALEGSTLSVSAGGILAELADGTVAPVGARLYLELELPDTGLVPCVVTVIESVPGRLRARFVDIAPIDRERLVRLVFVEQRRQAAARRVLR